MKNREIVDRINARVARLRGTFAERGLKLFSPSYKLWTLGCDNDDDGDYVEITLPEPLRSGLNEYVFSRRGDMLRIAAGCLGAYDLALEQYWDEIAREIEQEEAAEESEAAEVAR